MFEQDADARQIARSLRVSTKSVYQWRRAWRAGGEVALASKGAGGSPCKLDDGQLAQLRAALEAGPAAYGWEQDQRWTLARVAALIERLSGVSYTLRGVSFLLHRLGLSPQVLGPLRTESVGQVATAEQAIALVVERPPAGCGPAFAGTRYELAAYEASRDGRERLSE
ncbi:MAG: putative family transposase [Actinomycetia bacterium]|nr:putative family transposase [Actinomycetes bacterium]